MQTRRRNPQKPRILQWQVLTAHIMVSSIAAAMNSTSGAPKERGRWPSESAKASADLMLGSMGIPGAWDSGGAQA